MKRGIALIIIVAVLFSSSHLVLFEKDNRSLNLPETKDCSELAQEYYHSPIHISTIGNFAEQGFPGSGTAEDPFIIENLRIESAAWCIRIASITAHFVIRNCSFFGVGLGMEFILVQNGRVENCSFYTTTNGVDLTEVESCVFTRNYFNSSRNPIAIDRAQECNFTDSRIITDPTNTRPMIVENSRGLIIDNITILGNSEWIPSLQILNANSTIISNLNVTSIDVGISIISSTQIFLLNSSIKSQHYGVYLSNTENCILSQISVNSPTVAMSIEDSQSCTFDRVEITGYPTDSLFIYRTEDLLIQNSDLGVGIIHIWGDSLNYWSHTFVNVSSMGKTVGFLEGVTEGTYDVSSYSHLFVVSCEDSIFICNDTASLISLEVAFSYRCVFEGMNLTGPSGTMLYVFRSHGLEINNLVDNGVRDNAIMINDCNEVDLTNFTVISNSIEILLSGSCNLVSGNISSLGYGVMIENSVECRIQDCQITSNSMGSVLLYNSVSCSIVRCKLNLQLDILGSFDINYNLSIENVTVDNRKLGYFYDANTMTIDLTEYGQIILLECNSISMDGNGETALAGLTIIRCYDIKAKSFAFLSDSGLYVRECSDIVLQDITSLLWGYISIEDSSNVTIDQLSTTSSNVYFYNSAILTVNTSEFIDCSVHAYTCVSLQIRGCTFQSNWSPLYFSAIENSTITNCSISNTDDAALSCWSVINCVISFNSISAGGYGLYMEAASNTTVLQNVIISSWEGIHIANSNNLTVDSNSIIESFYAGIHCNRMSDSIVSSNFVQNSTRTGIYIENCNNISLALNCVVDSHEMGIVLEGSSETIIWGNFLARNLEGNAFDDGLTNEWHLQDIGNYWSDLGNNTAMDFESGPSSIDNYPLRIAGNTSDLPALRIVNDMQIHFGEENLRIDWIVWTDRPVKIEIYYNNFIVSTDEITHSELISWEISSFTLGVSSYRIAIYQDGTLIAQDIVIIEVLASTSLVTSVIASVAIISLVLVIEIHRRKRMEGVRRTTPQSDIDV